MSLNGSGVAVINSAGQPVVATTLITAAAFNAAMTDIATMISTAIMRDGQSTVSANIPFAGNKATGLGDGTAKQDAATLANVVNGTGVYVATVGGTADAITLTPSPAITAYAAGQTFRFIASGANTTAVTVAISGLAAKAITKNGTTALVAGDIPSAILVTITYDGTRFQLNALNPSGLYLPLSLIDAAGDLIVGTADNVPARLALGTARQVLRVNAGATAPAWEAPLTLGTPQVSTSGSTIDFTGIPSGVKRITISLVGVSSDGAAPYVLLLGDSGGFEATGYLSATTALLTNTMATGNVTTAFNIAQPATAAAVLHGTIVLTLENAATFTWTCHGMIASSAAAMLFVVAGSKSTSAELDRIRISIGADAFDAGEINVCYE